MAGSRIYADIVQPILVVGLGCLSMRADERSVRQGRQGPAE